MYKLECIHKLTMIPNLAIIVHQTKPNQTKRIDYLPKILMFKTTNFFGFLKIKELEDLSLRRGIGSVSGLNNYTVVRNLCSLIAHHYLCPIHNGVL